MKDMPGQLAAVAGQHAGHLDQYPVQNSVQNCENRRCLTRPTDLVIARSVSRHVIGVILTDDRGVHSSNHSDGIPLGIIVLDNMDINVDELQNQMHRQLITLPSSFDILTKKGWVVHKNQEHKVHISHVIRDDNAIIIKKHFDRPRAGILTTSGDSIGFIFIDTHCTLYQIRTAINDQLSSVITKQDYRFIEKNGWPVDYRQESLLTFYDISRNGCNIYIQYADRLCSSQSLELPVNNPCLSLSQIQNSRSKPTTRMKLPSFKKRSDLVAKPILISYVRAEAVQHAKDLKEGLLKLGFSVYLDVHEIKIGSDWQDALNYAVSNCNFFVPLITQSYGKTQWTNREVKLADVLGKNIIPISFIDQWPPECLAIQFASTQYIPWKLQDSEHIREESRIWEEIHIKRVCKELGERCRSTLKNTNEIQKVSGVSNMANFPVYGPRAPNPKLVVISAHPKQKLLTHELRVTLEAEGYEVWCSSDIQDQTDFISEDFSPSAANTPRELSSIPEGSVFGRAYYEIANTIADSKRGCTQKNETDSYPERRQLTRMISQVSDISQVSSLTPDKMERLKTFQQNTDKAGVVIIIVSEAYTRSKTSQQQVFYCEHRKKVVLVKFDQSSLPSWFTILMGNQMISNVHIPQFITTLKTQVKRCVNPSSSETPKVATFEAKIQCLVNSMKQNITQTETCVYIAGSSKLQTLRSDEIARAIGKELAKVKNITICTGGFYGAPDIVAKSFFEHIENNQDKFNTSREPVVHLLPLRDDKDFSAKANQNADLSFEAATYGKTHFVGDSVKERETAVARLFDTCIVIEGGPGAAHEVEEFIWNDHFVIPIISTGGAAGGQYGVPLKIFEAPPCVSKSDWCLLSEKEANSEDVAKAVVNIVVALKKSLVALSAVKELQIDLNKPKTKSRIARSRKSKVVKTSEHMKSFQTIQKEEAGQTYEELNGSDISGHKLLERQVASHNIRTHYKHTNKWQRFMKIFSATKL